MRRNEMNENTYASYYSQDSADSIAGNGSDMSETALEICIAIQELEDYTKKYTI